jgi:hypothetical protein
LLQGVEHEVCAHRRADLPADNASGEDVDDNRDIDEALAGGDVGEVGDPELIRPIRIQGPMDAVQWAWCGRVGRRGAHHLAASRTDQPLLAHQSLHSAACRGRVFAFQLPPDLANAVDLQIDPPDLLDLRHQRGITLHSGWSLLWIASPGRMASIADARAKATVRRAIGGSSAAPPSVTP